MARHPGSTASTAALAAAVAAGPSPPPGPHSPPAPPPAAVLGCTLCSRYHPLRAVGTSAILFWQRVMPWLPALAIHGRVPDCTCRQAAVEAARQNLATGGCIED